MKTWIIIFTMLASAETTAENIYKSTDKSGNVMYSSNPPDNNRVIEKIEPLPKPSEQQVQSAKQRYKELEIRAAEQAHEQKRLATEYKLYRKQKADLAWRRKIEKKDRRIVILFPGHYSIGTTQSR